MNYAETLAYWYLRLNGFFPLVRFVLHRDVAPREHPADSDLLAVRPPNVSERIGGAQVDLDPQLFGGDGYPGVLPPTHTVGLIVEVKGGDSQVGNAGQAFSPLRTEDAVDRLGIVPVELRGAALATLGQGAMFQSDGVTVAKLLIARRLGRGVRAPAVRRTEIQVPISHVDAFIRRRFWQFRNPKQADWHFFPSDLAQYLIWQGD